MDRPAAWAAYEQGKRQEEIARTQLTLAEQDVQEGPQLYARDPDRWQ